MSVNVNMTGTVVVGNSRLHIRNRPSMSGSIIGYLKDGDKLTITKKDGKWCYASNTGGWSHSDYIKLVDNGSAQTAQKTKEEQARLAAAEEAKRKEAELQRQLAEIEKYMNESTLNDKEIADGLLVNNLNGIYGIPYQFMASVDPRLSGSQLGRKYSERIISKMPLLCITPGKVSFMSNFSKSEKAGVFAALSNIASNNNIETPISEIIKKNGRYFTFEFNYKEYFEFVNPLCRAGARFLNIDNVTLDIGGTKAKAQYFDWSNALNKKFKSSLTSQEFIGFYVDSAHSISETFSNDTGKSQLSSTMDNVSDLAREVGFLMGAGAGKKIQVLDEAKLSNTMDTIREISDKYLNGNKLFTDIANDFATVAVGGKLLFPEIWTDSSFSRSFDISIKLRTPDNDIMSWYINIYVPLCHLIALAAGQQKGDSNGYYSPFLIRAFYKGLFNVDMGIITDLSITKGKEAAWNVHGLPTEVDVNMSIKDLYNMVSIVKGSNAKDFVTNNLLMDYIANSCGININQMDIQRSLEIYYILTTTRLRDLPNKISGKFQDIIDTYGMELFNGAMNKFLL